MIRNGLFLRYRIERRSFCAKSRFKQKSLNSEELGVQLPMNLADSEPRFIYIDESLYDEFWDERNYAFIYAYDVDRKLYKSKMKFQKFSKYIGAYDLDF